MEKTNTIKTSLRGKTHFDVESNMWTKNMMLRYIQFQESFNENRYNVLSEGELMRFAGLYESTEKQQKLFSKVYKQFKDNHWKTKNLQQLIEKYGCENN